VRRDMDVTSLTACNLEPWAYCRGTLALVAGIWLVLLGLSQVVSAFRARSAGKDIEHEFQRLTGSAT
jgi:predicted small secreted protein